MTPATEEKAPVNPYLIAVVVGMAAFMEVLDTTITNVSLTHIAGSLAASQDESTWVLTSYLVANGIVLPISGWLAGVMGRKNFFMLCIGGFTIASFMCGIAASLPMLIAFRLVQGLAGGGLQPMQQAITMDSFPPEKRGTAFSITGMTMIVAPVLGPTLGGFITDNYSWRWIFFMNVPIGILALVLVNRLVEDPPHAKAKGLIKIDYIGLSLVAICLGALQVVLDKGQEDDWFSSSFITTFAIISSVGFIAAVAWLMNQKDPVIDLGLMKQRSFGLACLMVFFVGFALYGCSALLPLLVQTQFGYDATTAGLVLSPGALALIVLMPMSGRLVNKFQARYMISFGMMSVALGMFVTAHVTPQTDYHTFVMMRVLQVAGLPFLFVPASVMAFSQILREKSSKASALYSLMRNLGGSIGISILESYVTRSQQAHQNYLAAHMSAANSTFRMVLGRYTDTIASLGHSHAAAGNIAMGRLFRELINQSSILAYRNGFLFVATVCFLLSFIALLMPSNRPKPVPAEKLAEAH